MEYCGTKTKWNLHKTHEHVEQFAVWCTAKAKQLCTMVWERPILRKKYYLLWKCSEIARNVLWRSNLIVFYLVHISRGLYTDWSISLYVITFWPELMRIWEKGPHSMIDFFQIFLIKNGSHFLIEYFVFSLYNVFKVKKKANE